jgi:hypothetical protein
MKCESVKGHVRQSIDQAFKSHKQGFPEELTQTTKQEVMVLYKIKPIFEVITLKC